MALNRVVYSEFVGSTSPRVDVGSRTPDLLIADQSFRSRRDFVP